MAERPFRHLCPEADARDAMTDDEFWQHVANNLTAPPWDDEDAGPDLDAAINVGVCGTCGSNAEGRPLIHADEEADHD